MNRYFGLLNTVAQEYGINKGAQEAEASWRARVMYSLIGQTGYASLWDVQEDLSPSSIVHLKGRIGNVLNSLISMYPEMTAVFMKDSGELSDEIYNIMSSAGCIYHEPHRVIASMRREAVMENCIFLRGQSVGEKRWMSGIGCYMPIENINTIDSCPLSEMFQLQKGTHISVWQQIISKIKWETSGSGIQLQYLRMEPPFRYGYWVDIPDKTGAISLSRTGYKGNYQYYLYKTDGQTQLLSSIPQWMTEDYNYRSISVACLASRGTLPPSTFRIDGDIVSIRIEYLYPPPELSFIKLYSWPEVYFNFPNDFNRVMSLGVFRDIKGVLEASGYRFEEE